MRQDRGRPRAFGGGEPGQQIVQQDHARPKLEGHRQLEQPARGRR
jgi:hypothetical protein